MPLWLAYGMWIMSGRSFKGFGERWCCALEGKTTSGMRWACPPHCRRWVRWPGMWAFQGVSQGTTTPEKNLPGTSTRSDSISVSCFSGPAPSMLRRNSKECALFPLRLQREAGFFSPLVCTIIFHLCEQNQIDAGNYWCCYNWSHAASAS